MAEPRPLPDLTTNSDHSVTARFDPLGPIVAGPRLFQMPFDKITR
jgi:hypothetical protein